MSVVSSVTKSTKVQNLETPGYYSENQIPQDIYYWGKDNGDEKRRGEENLRGVGDYNKGNKGGRNILITK